LLLVHLSSNRFKGIADMNPMVNMTWL
jgi:hypothetical protein